MKASRQCGKPWCHYLCRKRELASVRVLRAEWVLEKELGGRCLAEQCGCSWRCPHPVILYKNAWFQSCPWLQCCFLLVHSRWRLINLNPSRLRRIPVLSSGLLATASLLLVFGEWTSCRETSTEIPLALSLSLLTFSLPIPFKYKTINILKKELEADLRSAHPTAYWVGWVRCQGS